MPDQVTTSSAASISLPVRFTRNNLVYSPPRSPSPPPPRASSPSPEYWTCYEAPEWSSLTTPAGAQKPLRKLLVQDSGTADVSVSSRWFEGDKERWSLADQVKELDLQIQKDIDDAALKADKLAAKEAESSSIEDRFAEALRKKKEEETKPEETKPEEERC
ncbi:hypothetical protein FDENT_8454 [Fusarium denticulatum]|uniref:Uncharacterized protein n=1 Tax=Fusarium denticulatum TaxID=48507 RepID=A0A8H5X1W1_9HYPO|nr:hypothetical protein FDENT_8454 [Fusarium denticulatum]